jgi:23S rRNA (cytosine1962-C5)-methyltransferase
LSNLSTLILKQGKDKPVRNFHPWIFSGAVHQKPNALDGDLVQVLSFNKELLGHGFYSPESQIVCRIVDFGSKKVDFSFDYWNQKLQSAYQLRKRLNLGDTDAYRLVHAEADSLPGIVIDIYKNVAVIQFLILGTERISSFIFQSLTLLGFEFIYIKPNKVSEGKEQLNLREGWLESSHPELPVISKENGLKFIVDVEKGQKTGFFIDQRDNRQLLGQYAKGKSILNTFAYTGGFSVYAAANQAKLVHSIDISSDAVLTCEKNVRLNTPNANHTATKADTFSFFRENQTQYDIIVLDPPAFAKNAHSVQQAARGYKDLNLMAFKNVPSGGLVFTFSCSQHISSDLFQKIIFGAAADAGREVSIIHKISQAADHPINIYHPEGEYLKGLVLYIR